MLKRDVLLASHNFSKLKSFAKNAKIRSWLKFLLKRYYMHEKAFIYSKLTLQMEDETLYVHYSHSISGSKI